MQAAEFCDHLSRYSDNADHLGTLTTPLSISARIVSISPTG